MLAGALYTYKRDCLQGMAIESTLIGDIHFEAPGRHMIYMLKGIRQTS